MSSTAGFFSCYVLSPCLFGSFATSAAALFLGNLDPITFYFMVQKLYCPLSLLLQADNISIESLIRMIYSLMIYKRVVLIIFWHIPLPKVFNGLFPCVFRISLKVLHTLRDSLFVFMLITFPERKEVHWSIFSELYISLED